MTFEDIKQRMESDIGGCGWSVIATENDERSFAYTIGLSQFDHPEIIILGFEPFMACQVLNIIGDRIKKGESFVLPEDANVADVITKLPVKFKPAPDYIHDDYTFQARNRFPGCNVIQVILPGKNGKFPGDVGCHPQLNELQTIVPISAKEAVSG